MKTRLLCALASAALLFGAAVPAATAGSIFRADTPQPTVFTHALPVLVQVDAHGKITHVAPAFELRPRFRHLLRASLDTMITGPAHNHAGHAISSECVIYVSMNATPRSDGKYDFQFSYAGVKSVPYGPYHWRHIGDHRLVLVRVGSGFHYPIHRITKRLKVSPDYARWRTHAYLPAHAPVSRPAARTHIRATHAEPVTH